MNQAKILVAILLAWTSSSAFGQVPDRDKAIRPKSTAAKQLLDSTEGRPRATLARPPKLDAFSREEWSRIDASIERALAWIASQQQQDGSFSTIESGQPGVTSLCIMAFLSAGHVPAEGPYGDKLDRAIEYALKCQRNDGLFSASATNGPVTDWGGPTHTAAYNHAITGLMLGEVYGSGGSRRSQQIATAIEKGVAFTRKLQLNSRKYGVDAGGWRYIKPVNYGGAEQSDLSMTGWQIMFYRSAMNAGFDIPGEFMTEATDYVRRCFNRQQREFFYGIQGHHRVTTRAVTGSGLLCLYLSGQSDPEIERAAADWMLAHPFTPYNKSVNYMDRYHYGTYYISQAAFQLGGDDWAILYRRMSEALLANQHPEGSWDAEVQEPQFGNVYTSALVVLTLTPPYQLLPIYQR